MLVEATTALPTETGADTIAMGLFEDEGPEAGSPSRAVNRLLERGEAKGRLASLAVAHEGGRRVILVGLGPRQAFDAEQARRGAAAAERRAQELATRALCWAVPQSPGEDVVKGLIEGTLLHAYRFDRYKRDERPAGVERLIVSAQRDFSHTARESAIVVTAQNRARDLGNTPANDLPPAALAGYAEEVGEHHDTIEVSVLDETAIREAGMGAFAAVAQGSEQSGRLIRIEYEGPGANPDGPRIALVGKGLTFDSGGLSLKSAGAMEEMKFDMCGAAAVIEAIGALAQLEVPGRVLGVVGAAENLPSGRAVKPGDIVRALDGTTIEVDNTDAEGRLVLADCLAYARREGCRRLVDLATLTGAVVVALGSTYAGLMGNDEPWLEHVRRSAARAGEPVWQLPLHPDYAAMVKGRYAQLTNRTERREAMPITAAELLHHFVGDVPWAHLDIAGTAWDVPRPYYVGKGATGFGVRLLVELVRAAGTAS